MMYFLRHALMYFLIVLFVLCLITFLTELIEYLNSDEEKIDKKFTKALYGKNKDFL